MYNKLSGNNIDLPAVNRKENKKRCFTGTMTYLKRKLDHEIFGRSNSEFDCLKYYSNSSKQWLLSWFVVQRQV